MRILIVDDRVPDPHFGAGFPRAYRLLLSFIELGHSIYFFPTIKQTIKELNLTMLKSYGIDVIDNIESLKDQKIDVTILSRPHNVHYYLPIVRQILPAAKVIYDTEALWYRRYDLQLSVTGRLPTWAYRYDELGLARQVDLCWVVNDIEKKILSDNGVRRIVKLAHALNTISGGEPFENRKDILVVGGILEEDSSNEDGLWWYLDNCWESTHSILGCQINITGKNHSTRLRNHKLPSVNLMGHVDNLVPLYQNQKIFVATTRFATGIPWKVHEAMAHGIPCVISKLLADQLGVIEDEDALISYNAQQAIDKTVQLYQNKELWLKVRENGYKLVERDCRPENFKTIVGATLAELVE